MRILTFIVLLFSLASIALAQDEDDGGYLETLLEDSLSGLGREVKITGFEGALSSNATLREMTIADADGVWLTMRNASLVWTRTALLRGRLKVDELIASEILISRLPKSEKKIETEDAHAKPFALPELPVSVDIGVLRAPRVELGPEILGETALLSLEGMAQLSDGQGNVTLDILRQDRGDHLKMSGGFSNETRTLDINVNLEEQPNGLVSTALNLPGHPSISLSIAGNAPLSDFLATIALATDGQPRLSGQVTLKDETPDAEADNTEPHRTFSADLSGNLRSLFADELQPFFGDHARLYLVGRTEAQGATRIDAFELSSAALDLKGSLEMSGNGWPRRILLNGDIGLDDPVRLPVSGAAMYIRRAKIEALYDEDQGDAWQLETSVDSFQRNALAIDTLGLKINGTLSRDAPREISGRILIGVEGLAHDDPDMSRALGRSLSGRSDFFWAEKSPLNFKNLRVSSGDASLMGDIAIEAKKEGAPTTGRIKISAKDLTRFSGVAGRALGGKIDVTLEGAAEPLGGFFDAELNATTTGLKIGEPRIDPLLQGESILSLAAKRDLDGTVIDRMDILNSNVSTNISGKISQHSGALDLTANLSNLELVEPSLAGPANLRANADWAAGGMLTINTLTAQGAGLSLSAGGALNPEDPAFPASGSLSLNAEDLSNFTALAKRPLAGSLDLDVSGSGRLNADEYDVQASLDGAGLKTGMIELDQIIDGAVSLVLDAAFAPDALDMRDLSLETPQITAQITGDGPQTPLAVAVKLANVARLAPGFDGPLDATGTVDLMGSAGKKARLDLSATGPAGSKLTITGDVVDLGKTVDLALNGAAPVGLINKFIAPNSVQGNASFDLAVNGPPALPSVSGAITLSDIRIAMPDINAAFENGNGTVALSEAAAQIDFATRATAGGDIRISGPVTLSAPFSANLETTINRLRFQDPDLFETLLDGVINVSGPLTGGALISGAITLLETEIRVTPAAAAAFSDFPEIKHLNEPSKVRKTRLRAGLIKQEKSNPASYPLDLSINAPNKIFVRGSGLDAELGGALQVSGATDNVEPSGFFELIRGRFTIFGKRLDLTEGLIDLRGALDPYLRFVAESNSDDYVVQVILEGLASEPEISFASQPELPEEEALAHLLFGRGLNEISPFQAAQIAAGAVGVTGGGGGILGRVRSLFGLSDLDVASDGGGGTSVSAGGYISDNVYSSVSTDSEGRREINLNLDISPSLTAKGRTNTDGESGLGLFFERDY